VQHNDGKPRRWTWVADSLLLFALATALLNPLYRFEYLDAWNSIEATFISDARFLSEHWPHPRWQPNWYTGTRYDYIYPPALRYGTAALSRLRHVSTARSYHLYIALLYSIGIAGVYLFVRTGSRSRWTAIWAAAASAAVSPAYLLFKIFRLDNAGVYYMPMRLGVLVRYGEGPHMSSFALLPISLAAAGVGLRRARPGYLAVSAVVAALVVANNFYGATALAMFFPIVAWSVWLGEQDWMVWGRAALVGVLAWGLDAFWLTPSYVRVTLDNMRWVSSPGHGWSAALGAVVVAAYAWLSWKYARGRPERAWAAFVLGSLALFALNVAGNQYFDFRVIGEPGRLIPELELTIFVAVALLFAWMSRKGRWPRVAAVALAIACIVPGIGYLKRAWRVLPPRASHVSRIEYTLTDWIHRNLPGVRSLATGSVRFWYNAWYDLPQLGGGSEQGLLNANVQEAYVTGLANDNIDQAVTWLQATGVGAIIVHDKNSQEVYHDWTNPTKFEGKLEKIFDDAAGNRIYRVPLKSPRPARVVQASALQAVRPSGPGDYPSVLRYVEVIEHGPDTPLEFQMIGSDGMRLRSRLDAGQMLLVQQTYDPAWKAYSGGHAVTVSRDPLGFLLVDPGPGDHEVALQFETPLENRLGSMAFGATLLALAGLGWRAFRIARQ
jgi:hypothetical protein